MDNRKTFYEGIPNFWSDLYGEEYALYDLLSVSQEDINELRQCAERVGRVFTKTAQLLRQADDATLMLLGYPRESKEFIRLKTMTAETIISRLDIVKSEQGYKVLEYNSDTPTFIKETFAVNGEVCRHFSVANVNEGEEKRLQQAVDEAVKECSIGVDNPYVVFTSHLDHEEDRLTVQYLQQLCTYESTYVPLQDLQIRRDVGLFDKHDKKIDVLYRQTFPIEQLLLDRGEHGEEIGLYFLELVQAGLLRIINPPSAFLLQSKGVMSVIWSLHEIHHDYFTDEEHDWIESYFLPTYLEEDMFLDRNEGYVKKPVFGREGDTVEIYDGNGDKQEENQYKTYNDVPYVYQQYIELPTTTFASEKGVQTGHYLFGVFLINGQPSSIGCRIGNKITDNLSYYYPMGIKEA
ncbi:MAG: glutathionylspermidine synthase family protein [Bacillaceae bacterium]